MDNLSAVVSTSRGRHLREKSEERPLLEPGLYCGGGFLCLNEPPSCVVRASFAPARASEVQGDGLDCCRLFLQDPLEGSEGDAE